LWVVVLPGALGSVSTEADCITVVGMGNRGGSSGINGGFFENRLSLRDLFEEVLVYDLLNFWPSGGGVWSSPLNPSEPSGFVMLADETELAAVEPSPLLLFSSGLCGEGDLETAGEFHGRLVKLVRL
jgi:hypothetical protein